MATIFKGYRPRIARQMAAGDAEIMRWLGAAIFAKASTGHWLAWRADKPDRMAVLPPNHPEGQPCRWIDAWDNEETIETGIAYVESGRFASTPPATFNIELRRVWDRKTGKRLTELEDGDGRPTNQAATPAKPRMVFNLFFEGEEPEELPDGDED